MHKLSESIKKTIAIADGWKLGRLIFENDGKPYVELGEINNRSYLEIDTNLVVEVLNDGEWYRLRTEDFKKVTVEGWPLFGGFDCRHKEGV